MFRGLAICSVSAILSCSTALPYVFGVDSASAAASDSTKTQTETSSKNVTGEDSGSTLVIDSIQDVAYTLQRIRQQAINIYVEATRKEVHRYNLDITSLSAMPDTPLEEQSAYLPLRKAWLVFFIGTMEPLVQILNEHMHSLEERTVESHLPSQSLPEWNGIVSEWKSAIEKLNKQLDGCAALVDDTAPDNVEVARAARAIDSQVSSLENILHKASKFLQEKMP
jgi:hypothetical protein